MMKHSTFLILTAFFFLGAQLQAQMPPSVAEAFSRPHFAGLRPKANAKTNIAMENSIKAQVRDRLTALGAEEVKRQVISAYHACGYKDEEMEEILSLQAELVSMLAIGSAMQTSRSNTMLWSGTSNPFVDEQPMQDHTEKFGNQHQNYDPKKPFWQESTWSANNFKDPAGVFSFDYTMRMQVIAPQGSHSLTIYLNSRDGSIGLSGTEAGYLSAGISAGDGIDFLALSKIGRSVLFTTSITGQKKSRLVEHALQVPNMENGSSDAEAARNELIIKDLDDWDQIVTPVSELEANYRNRYKCFEGIPDGSDSSMGLCFGGDAADVLTLVPNLGFGVGIFKDYINERNRLLLRRKIQNKQFSMVFLLESLDKKSFQFDGKPYEYFVGTEQNYDNARVLKKELEELQNQRKGLKEQKSNVQKNLAGCRNSEACKRRYRPQLEQINQDMERLDDRIEEKEEQLERLFQRRN